MMGIRIFLAWERIDVSFAALVNIIDDPSLLGLACAGGPCTFPDGHAASLACCSLWELAPVVKSGYG
jgi:hypothetical protein